MTSLKSLLIWLLTSVNAPVDLQPCSDPSGTTCSVQQPADTDDPPGDTRELPPRPPREGAEDGIYNGF